MESQKLKNKLKCLIENFDTQIVKIRLKSVKAEVLTGIATDTNGNVETFSKNKALEDENKTDEDLNKHRKCELNTVFLEGGKKCEGSFSNGLTSDGVSFELNKFESSPNQTNSSSYSVASQTSFEILELHSYVDEKFEFGDSKDESNLSLKRLDITDSKMNSQDTLDEKRSVVSKHFECSENAVREQNRSLLIKEEIRDLTKILEKCFNSYLEKLETIALKRGKLPLKKGNKFPKSDKSDLKNSGKKGKNSDFILPSSNNLENNINTYNDNKNKSQQEGLVQFNDHRDDCMESGEKKRNWKFQDIKVHNSIAAKNQPSHEALQKKLHMVEKESNEKSYLTRCSGKIGKIKKKRTIITTERRQANGLIIVSLMLILVYLRFRRYFIELLFN